MNIEPTPIYDFGNLSFNHLSTDPRWQPPVPDPFFMKRVNITDLTKSLKSPIESLTQTESSSLSEEASVQKALKLLESSVDSSSRLLSEREELLQKEILLEEDAKLAKMTSENIKTGFDKTVSDRP